MASPSRVRWLRAREIWLDSQPAFFRSTCACGVARVLEQTPVCDSWIRARSPDFTLSWWSARRDCDDEHCCDRTGSASKHGTRTRATADRWAFRDNGLRTPAWPWLRTAVRLFARRRSTKAVSIRYPVAHGITESSGAGRDHSVANDTLSPSQRELLRPNRRRLASFAATPALEDVWTRHV